MKAPLPGTPALELEGVAVAYRDRRVLHGVDLRLAPGLVHGLIGPNGAGKSTLLKACLDLVPSTGDIAVHGHALRRLGVRARAHFMAYLAQDAAVDADFTGEDFVRMSRYARLPRFGSMSAEDERAVADALRLTGARAWADRPLRRTSGGERQLTALARALAQDPAVLLLDEPISALDLSHEVDVLRLLRPWIDEGTGPRTVVVVLHDLTLAARFCDRLTLIADGGVLCQGTPEEVLTREHLTRAYGVDVHISTTPVTGTVLVTPL